MALEAFYLYSCSTSALEPRKESTHKNAGCCHSLGGFDKDDEDDFDKMARADRAKAERREREQQQPKEQQNVDSTDGERSHGVRDDDGGEITEIKSSQPVSTPNMHVAPTNSIHRAE